MGCIQAIEAGSGVANIHSDERQEIRELDVWYLDRWLMAEVTVTDRQSGTLKGRILKYRIKNGKTDVWTWTAV